MAAVAPAKVEFPGGVGVRGRELGMGSRREKYLDRQNSKLGNRNLLGPRSWRG